MAPEEEEEEKEEEELVVVVLVVEVVVVLISFSCGKEQYLWQIVTKITAGLYVQD